MGLGAQEQPVVPEEVDEKAVMNMSELARISDNRGAVMAGHLAAKSVAELQSNYGRYVMTDVRSRGEMITRCSRSAEDIYVFTTTDGVRAAFWPTQCIIVVDGPAGGFLSYGRLGLPVHGQRGVFLIKADKVQAAVLQRRE